MNQNDSAVQSTSKWVCSLCNVSFTLEKNLRAHEKTSLTHLRNAGLNPALKLSCQVCGLELAKKSGLKRHLMTQHGVELDLNVATPIVSKKIRRDLEDQHFVEEHEGIISCSTLLSLSILARRLTS
jgi:hypothetical protein